MTIAIDLTGERFERLLVLSRAPKSDGHKNANWLCQCDCGSIKIIRGNLLRTGGTRSCGCLARETASRLMKTHGLSKTSEFSIWNAMRKRCNDSANASWSSHGGRGIKVCERWQTSFENFYEDMGQRPSKKHSLDRINNDENYEPGNCRWATASMQGRNTSKNRMVTIDDVTLCVADWCELMSIDRHKPYTMLYWNKRRKLASIDEAVEVLYREWQSP